MPTQARERLLRAAEELFYAEGIRAVGVERLLTVSGVGRASFYRHFDGKDDLVVATIRSYSAHRLAWLREAVAAADGDPLAAFDALAASFGAPDYRGCASINAMVEAADPASAAHLAAADHKIALTTFLRDRLTARGHTDPGLAEKLVLLLDGATVTALRERSARPARQARELAELMLARA
ncbi:TetR/AcrR family transcriptional regulator [Actinokineospora enzanensis]|uniref:TetR/AcrR family transcriptional regulator n=1 Tax=Actinokineospora enzanensis TaxID=155975 RepID=UPI000371C263|nr:TetR/AcrR family transcriptional regulator [Actinokineospora enzanensis]